MLYNFKFISEEGCDSIVTLTLIVVEAEATVATPPVLGCGGSTVTLDGVVGEVMVKATQPGDGTFSPAPEIILSFQVGFC